MDMCRQGLGVRLGDVCGFSLPELLIAMLVGTIVMVASIGLFARYNRDNTTQDVIVGLQQGVRASLILMERELRLAGLDPLDSTGAGFEVATADAVRITLDRNLNGTIDQTDRERLTYRFDATTQDLNLVLYEDTAAETTALLLDSVAGLVFTYLDEDDTSTTVLADIRTVLISLTMQESAGAAGDKQRTYVLRVGCRNMRL
jgi:prepilin-type N-terminal cleavage/methylation domain-containing protein